MGPVLRRAGAGFHLLAGVKRHGKGEFGQNPGFSLPPAIGGQPPQHSAAGFSRGRYGR
jgi:hypothetical protein